MIKSFEDLKNCDLVIDAIYEGGNKGNFGDDPIARIFPVGNQGGFRYAGEINNLKYVILYTTGDERDWPDYINRKNSVYIYYGDNKNPDNELHDTKKKGNLILKNIFDSLNSELEPRKYIPPIFIFKKHLTKSGRRAVQFKGVCVPGGAYINGTEELIAIWKGSDKLRYQNYKAIFTILDITLVNRKWINELNLGFWNTYNAPKAFLEFKEKGIYKPLKII